MRRVLLLTFLLVACAPHKTESSRAAAPANDVILITIDTLRADSVGFAGNTRVKTPFLDALASRGVVFTNAHAHNVITLPSHVNILTGLYPFQHGVRENAGFKLDPKHLTVASMLRRQGYATGAFIGAFPLDARYGLNQGFDTYDDNYGKGEATADFVVQERRASAVLESAVKWWRSNEGRKRFMWVHLYDPHAPYSPPDPFNAQFRDDEYLGEISYVDAQLQQQLAPLLGNAFVVVTGDHGEARGEHGEETHGLFAYEPTLKIPLVVAGPGVQHRVVADYVRHIDIVPTILEAAGGQKPGDLRGQSLLDATIGSRDSYFESLSASINRGWAPLTGIIHNQTKYIDLPITELYDLPRDPHEQKNVRDDRRRDVEEARKLLAPLIAAPATRGTISEEEAANLRALGYISGAAAARHDYTAADDPKTLVPLDRKMHDAIDAFEHGDRAKAERLAGEVVKVRPEMDAGRTLYAFMLQQNEKLGPAIEQLRVVTSKPNAATDDLVQLGLLYSETGNPRAAVDLLAPRATGGDPDVLNTYGVALSDSGKPDLAAQQFQRVLASDPNNAPALQNLGILSLKRGDMQAAATSLTHALELNPRLPLAWNTLGVVYAQQGDFGRAVDFWKRAVAIDPHQYDALFNTAIVEAKAGHVAEAREAFSRFVATAPRERYAADIASARRALEGLH